MQVPTDHVFPGLAAVLTTDRFAQVDRAVQGLLTRTLRYRDDGLPFIITGDIPAMWLRDSTWQAKPLLLSRHPDVVDLLVNLSRTQVALFLIDPYANAFNRVPDGNCWHRDFPDQSPWVFERKFELDSWASVLYLARMVVEHFGRTDHLDAAFRDALSLMLHLAQREQDHDPDSYVFHRDNGLPHDSLSHRGRGAPVCHTGMIYSAFRPSDDACTYGYLIPANLFFMNELHRLPQCLRTPLSDEIAAQIDTGIQRHAIVDGIYAYEVDGRGNSSVMDDANVPSLLSLPYLGAVEYDDPMYLRTRQTILSAANPYFYSGSHAQGIGSQHTPPQHVWPIAIAMEALTSADPVHQLRTLDVLEACDAGTGFMHESFHVDDPTVFTRPWFSWSDMTYVDLVLASVGYQPPRSKAL